MATTTPVLLDIRELASLMAGLQWLTAFRNDESVAVADINEMASDGESIEPMAASELEALADRLVPYLNRLRIVAKAEAAFLTAPTEGDLRRQAAERERAAADARMRAAAPPPEDFRLAGSNRTVDLAEAAGQTCIFDGRA